MSSKTVPSIRRSAQKRRLAPVLAAVAAVALVASGAATASAATSSTVAAAELGTTYATPGQTGWLTTSGGGGSASITADSFDSRSAVKLSLPTSSSQASVYRTFGAGVRPTSIPALLDGASFSYAGNNVNFQLGIFYTPTDPTYGPTAPVETKCTQAADGGVPLVGQCYAVIKYEPGVTSPGAYSTVTLGDKQAMFNGETQPGWWNTQRVGQFAANDRTTSLDGLLGQMASYEVFIVGASMGSGGAGDAWVLNLTFGDNSYGFGDVPVPTPAQPAPAPATAALVELIDAESIDVAADTAKFVAAPENPLTAVDPAKPFSGTFAWENPTDAFVDVFSYSTAQHLGTFPVVNGSAVIAGVDVSHLSAGDHYLVLQGQTSAALAVVAFTAVAAGVTGGAVLPATGSPILPLGAAALLIVAAGVVVLGARRIAVRG